MLSLSKFRDKAQGFPDLLNPAALIEDGIILNKNGSLTSSFFYEGSDLSASHPSERNATSARLNAALARLGSGWMLNQDAIRIGSEKYLAGKTSFSNRISQLIDDEKRHRFNTNPAYKSAYALTLTYMPPLRSQSKLVQLMVDEEKEGKDNLTEQIIQYFKNTVAEFTDGLSSDLKIEQMKAVHWVDEYDQSHVSDQMLRFLNYTICGVNHPVNLPPVPMYLDSVIGAHEFVSGLTPKIGDKFISVVAIDGFPHESYPGILSRLDEMPIEYRWSTRFIFADKADAISQLNKYRRKWQQKVRGFADQILRTSKGAINEDALRMVQETQTAISEAEGGIVSYGYYTSCIVLMSHDSATLAENAKNVRKQIQDLGFGCRIETINTVEAFLGSIPGHAEPNLRRPMLHTMNLADLLPISSIWSGEEFNPSSYYAKNSPALLQAYTHGATPFRLNIHVSDIGHTLVIGPSSSGKSTLLAMIAAQFDKYPDSTVFAFDQGYSMLAMTLASGGNHFDISSEAEGKLNFCPLYHMNSDSEQTWASEWISSLLRFQNVEVTPAQEGRINDALTLIRSKGGRSLSDFVITIQDQELKDALKHYTVDGPMGSLFDATEDSLKFSNFTTIEIGDFVETGDRNVIPFLQYVFRRIEKRLNGQPALIILDEAWLMLGHPVFRGKIGEWLRTLRKANCALVLATQSPNDFAASDLLEIINSQCKAKIFLPNSTASEDSSIPLYTKLGLNKTETNIISNAIPKRQYYYSSPIGKRLFDLGLGPIALSFTSVADKDNVKMIRSLFNRHGEKWPEKWLDYRGIPFNHLQNNTYQEGMS